MADPSRRPEPHFVGPRRQLDDPLPGSTDVVTVLLAAHHGNIWAYYALMATAGAVSAAILPIAWLAKAVKRLWRRGFPGVRPTGYMRSLNAGLRRGCDPRSSAAAVSHRAHAFGGGRHAISHQEVFDRLSRWPRHSLRSPGISRGALRAHIVRFFALYYWDVLFVLLAFTVLGGLFGVIQYKRGQRSRNSESPRPASQARRRVA